jgi:hypothetical protein
MDIVKAKPNLVAPGVKAFTELTLSNCRRLKESYINIAWNTGLCLLLLGLVGGFLYYRYTGKPTELEIQAQRTEAHTYIMKKLGSNVAVRQMQQKQALAENNGMLTGLPPYSNDLMQPK